MTDIQIRRFTADGDPPLWRSQDIGADGRFGAQGFKNPAADPYQNRSFGRLDSV
jgi:hypothetical protein